MPDFDKDLNVKIEDVKSTPFDLTATAPKPATPYTQSLDRLDYSGATDVFARLREASQQSDPSGKGVFITNAELDANKRYETFNPTIPNYEDFAAYGQSISDKAANGILKGLNLAATTVAGGFGMLYGAIRSPFSGRLADIWDNEVMRGLDDWNTKVDQEYLPNYYTDAEKNSAWYSTNNWFKANFLFDKLIKNSGFAVGAMVSGNIANAGILRAGAALGKAAMAGATAAEASQAFRLFTPLLRNTARAFSSAKNIEVAAILEKEISSIADLTSKTSKIGELSKTANAFADFGNGARRTAIAAYSTAGEASFEAMQTSNEYRENLIQKYKDENYGQEPTEEILKEINLKSEKLGKASFFGNLAILGVTEFVQLPHILGSSYSATKEASNSLLGKIGRTEMIDGVETAIKPKTRFGKLYEKVSGVGKYAFDPKEAGQEGLQYALQVGTQNYYNKAFEGNDADFLVDGVLYGLFGKDELGQGKGALVSKEGLEGMVLGGITGGLMQAKGKYKESKQIAENTQRYLNEIKDAPTFQAAFKDRLRSINRNTVLQEQQQDLIVQGDKLEAKDLEADIAHNYLSTRIKYGRYEMVKDDINDLRAQSIDETGLSALKQQGMANVNDTLESFREKLNNFENVAKYTSEIYRSLDLRYSGETNEDGSRKYSPVVIDKMAYMSAKIANYDIRIPQLNAGLASNGIVTFDVLENILEKNKPAKKVIADATAEIEKLDIHPDLKTDLITNLKHIVELSLRRKLFLNEFENIKLNPGKYETLESAIDEFLSKSSLAAEFKNKEGATEAIEVDREYQISKSKKALVDKIEDDKWQVTSPDGTVTFYPSKEKADEFAKTINAEFDGLDKIKILGINSEGKIKIEDSNGDVYYIDPAMLNGYEKVKSSQEKLLKDKNDIDAQQAEIENKSGDTSTGVPEEDDKKIVYEDGFRKILSRIFTSTTAQSEKDPTKLIPSSKRANIFRNNLKNFKNKLNIRLILVTQKQEAGLGLDGLANLSMGSVGTHTNVDNGFIAAVYVEQDGATLYFVNEKGERTGKVGEKVALDKMIFDTMPSTSLSTPAGLRFDEKTTKEEDVQELANQWRDTREKLLNITGSPEMYSFDLSRGIPKISNKTARHAVGKTLVSEDLISTQQGLIVIPTTKTITHQGETINFPNGRPVLQYEDTLQPLNNRKFNKKEAEAIFLVIQYLCDNIKKQSEQGQKVKIDRNFATFLQSVLYYRKSADTAKNQFYIDTATMDFFFGGKMYDITKIAESKDAIIKQLLDVYNNVNNYTLTKDFDATFREYYINDKGLLVINNWENYQTYLMSSTYPNGTARPEQEIPLTTNVDKITDLAPTNYMAKYSILQGLELAQVVIVPVAPVAPAPVIITPAPIVTPVVEPVVEKVLSDDEKVRSFITAKISSSLPGSYDLDGDNFKFSAGYISFTAKLNDKGKYDVTFDANDAGNIETITKIKDTPASMVAINNFIELSKPKAPEAPAPVVSDLEAKKADIERRKKEYLSLPIIKVEEKDTWMYNLGTFMTKDGEFNGVTVEDVVKKINAKYKKELDALEGAEPTEQKPKLSLYTEQPNEISNFPLLKDENGVKRYIPESIAEKAWKVYDAKYKSGQSLERVKQRGGFAISEMDEFYPEWRNEIAELEENKPTAKFNQSFGDFTVYEGSDGSYDVLDDVEEGVIAEYVKTKEEAILIAKQADVKRKREKELEKLPNNGIVAQGDVGTTSAAADKIIDAAESELSKLKEDKSIADKNNEIEAKRAAIIDDWAAESMADQQYWSELALSAAEDGGNIDSPESYEESLEWEKNGTPREQSAKKINEKYEKLLAELDATKPAASTPTTTEKKGLKNKIADEDIEFRKVGRNEENVEKMSDLDIQLFKEWHAKNVSTIPYEVLDGVIRINSTEKAWGAFEAGVAKFYKGAIRGTEYHEIFEGIWKAFLTPEQRQNILDEFKSQKGTFLDRESGKRISYDEATDLQAKERIADDFSEFRLGKLPGRTIKEKILKFFRDIINFFKSFVQKPSLKRDLFKDINKGKYKKRVISESVKNEPIEYSKIGNLTETQSYNFVQDITARVFQIIFSTNQSLYNLEKLNSGEVFNQIKNVYLKYKVIDDLDPDQLTSSEFDELIGRTKDFLRVFKIDFDHDSDVTFNNDSRDRNEYASSPFVTDWKKLSPFAIKIVLASLTETVSTNQENKSLSLPKLKKDPETDTFKLLNFSRAFATCLSQFANTTDVSDLIDKLGELAKFDSNYVRLYTRLGGVANTEKAHINFAKFKMDDWRLFVNFYQTFSKQKPDALIQYINGGSVHTATANLFEAKKDIKSNWIENLKGMVGKPDSLITYNYETNAYKIKTRKKDKKNENESNGVLDFPIRSTQDKIAFLAKIGIEFPIEAYGKLKTRGKTNQVEEFGKAVSAIREYFGSNQDVLSFTGKTLGVNAQYDKLAELFVKVTNPNQELSFFGIDQKKIQAYAENNAISILENEFNSCKTLDELLALRPELTDLFSKHSVVLKKGGLFFNSAGKRIREFKVAYIQGTSDQDLGKDVVTTSLTLGNRYVQQFNQNLMGNYYILVPADSSTEWMMNLGNIIKFADVESQKGKFAREQMYEIFMGYLEDDIALALADRKELRNVAPRAKELRFFNDILSKELLKDINQLIADDANTDQVETFLKDKDNIDKINASIDLYIKEYNDATIQTLKETKRVVNGSKKNYKFIDLDADFSLAEKLDKEDLSEKELNDIVMFANVNYIINNIELHKLLFGDPYQFAIKDGQLDETKRTKAFLSGRRKMFNTPEFNTFLNNMNQAGTIEDIENNEGIKLRGPDVNNEDDFGDPGYHLNKNYANTVTFEDVEIIGSIATLDGIPSEIQKAYAKKAKETDGISFLMDGAYKEIKFKNGQWPREAEEWHQWQMAYTRQNFPGYAYKDAALEAHDKALVSKPEPKFMIDVLKPIVSGTEHNSTSIKLVLDKFSQMPLYFSMVKGTNLEKMYVNMFKQQIDYAVVLSGRKVGAGAAHPIYNKDGSFNETKYNNRVKVSWASYGIQVENAYQEGKQQPRGSQITKLVSIDIFDNGVATSERAQKEYDRNKKLLGLLHKHGYESFLKKLGIVDLGNGRFQLINNVAVSETLIHEMLRRALSTNAKSTVTLNKDKQFPMPFEASTSYLQIREILFSMIDKAVLSPKMNGSPHVQVPITGWENMGDRELLQKIDGKWTKINKKKYLALSDEEKSKVVITDTTLKFYTREKPYCEILLPHWFKEKLGKNSKFKDEKVLLAYLNTEEGRKILSGIGFRIPTQSLSSMEVFRVKGFLPASMGSTVVVPSEIVTKAGSDFDIDKLNMYLKSIYIDVNGNIKLVEYKDSEEATREFYSNLFDEKLSKKIVTKKELIEAAIIYASQGEDPKNLVEKYGYILDTLTEEYDSKDAYINALEDQLDELGDTNLQEQLKEKFVDEMYKRSLENEYYDSLEKIITLPENFDRLISPVDDAGLEDVSKELDDLAGIDEANIPNRILNRNYMTALRHAFVIAKRWVGIAAVNITGQSLTQKSQVYIDPSRFGKLSKSDKKILGDGSIALDHNTTMVDGVSRISMSGVKTADDKHYISSRLSGYITSFVDVAKNPYILKIIKSNLIVGTFMFLERIGVGENAAFFLNQPIISDYLKYLDSIDSKTLFSPKNIKFIKASYGDESSGGFDISLLKENIKNGGTNRAEQVAIFDEFLKYAKMAEFSFKLTQASNYDTAKIRSSGALLKKRILTDKARKSNIFSSVDNILNNSFIAEQSSFASKGFEALGEILKFDQPKFRDIINKVLTPFASREFMSDDDYARIENKIVASFVDYVIQIKSNIGSEIKELLISPDTTVASQLVKAKQGYPDMKILNDLQVASSPRLDNGAKSIKLGVNIKEAYDEDLYIGMMRELRDTEELNSLYRNILKVAILQGTYQSAISLKNIIPIEDYSAEVAPIISKLTDDLDVQAFTKGWFQRNNFKGEDVFKTATPKFFHTSSSYETGPVPIFVDNFGNETYLYYSYSFPFLESMQLGGLDRKILVLNETFNYLDVQSDHVKVMRVVTDRKTGEKIDMETGETVLPSAYSEAKKKGDLSLRNIYGYEKVKHDDGTPLTFITDYKGDDMVNHVYKLINLYGENPFVTEHRSTFEPSEIDNGTIKIKNEIPNADIINYFVNKYPSQALQSEFTEEEAPTAVSGEVIQKSSKSDADLVALLITSENMESFIDKVVKSNNMTYQQFSNEMDRLLSKPELLFDAIPVVKRAKAYADSEAVNEYGLTAENFESTVPDANMAISNFYESLTQEEKDKLGSIEDIISDYESIPFDSSYEDYIESLKCKL